MMCYCSNSCTSVVSKKQADGAVDEIYRYSSGTVRMVNKVATHSLIYGAANKHRIIDNHMVKRVIAGELT